MKKELSKEVQDAIDKGFLKNTKMVLKPVPREGKMVGLDQPQHVNYFMANNTSEWFVIPLSRKGDRIDIFNSNAEREFFENAIGKDMNVNDDNGFLAEFSVKVTKDDYLMKNGEEFDCTKPIDMLRVKVLQVQEHIGDSWENRFEGLYKWVLVDKQDEEDKAADKISVNQAAYIAYGKIEDSEYKMKNFLNIHFNNKGESKKVGSNKDKNWLSAEIFKIISESPSEFLETIKDEHYDIKEFILNAMSVGSIEKLGEREYRFVGDEDTYSFKELAAFLAVQKEEQSDLYMQIRSQISER